MDLQQKHVEDARILIDRLELLRRIPKGGISCEVGVAAGGYSRSMLDIIQPEKHYMIDAWQHAGRYDEAMYQAVLNDFAPEIETNKVQIIRSKSYTGMMQLPDQSIDFIYIDTSHSYKDTKLELEVAKDKIKPTGIIAGHDYKIGRFVPERSSFLNYGVIQAVNEFMINYAFRLKYLTFESDQFYSFAIQNRQ